MAGSDDDLEAAPSDPEPETPVEVEEDEVEVLPWDDREGDGRDTPDSTPVKRFLRWTGIMAPLPAAGPAAKDPILIPQQERVLVPATATAPVRRAAAVAPPVPSPTTSTRSTSPP